MVKALKNNLHFHLLITFCLCVFFTNIAMAKDTMHKSFSDSVTVNLWKGNPPFAKPARPEKVLPSKGDGVIRITNVFNPTITVYPSPESGKNRPAILICPGGGYQILAYNLEGTEIASWIKTLGIVPIILKYRVPNQRMGAFADVQRAMSIIRSHAREWNINPEEIGIIGFSAGGNLAARLSTHYKHRVYKLRDNMATSIKPDFCILIYPAYLVNKKDQLKQDVKIVDQPPPTFLVQTQDDPIGYRNSLFFFNALTLHHVPAEFHMFAHGGHGYGLTTPKTNPLSTWPKLCAVWLKSLKIIS